MALPIAEILRHPYEWDMGPLGTIDMAQVDLWLCIYVDGLEWGCGTAIEALMSWTGTR